MRLIDADEAMRMMKNCKADNPYFNGKTTPIWETALDCAVSCVEASPTIDPASLRPKGEWVCLEAEIGYFACSLCDHRILRAKCNFCPNCGADMRAGRVSRPYEEE